MDERQKQLTDLNKYIEDVDGELTKIIDSLQWDRRTLSQGKNLVTCKYDSNHRVPLNNKEIHEQKCLLKSQGYVHDDVLLPDPPEDNLMTLVKLGKHEITQIINRASNLDPTFKKGIGDQVQEPMMLERLQCVYTMDERRAIHEAVVAAVPACHDLSDLALLSTNGEEQKCPNAKSRMEVLAELRDMKRRRTKYRVAAKTKNYSDVLRDVIKIQMEIYTETQNEIKTNKTPENIIKIKTEPHSDDSVTYKEAKDFTKDKNKCSEDSRSNYKTDRHRYEERSLHTSRDTSRDGSRNHYKYDRYKNMKHNSRSNDEFRRRTDNRRYEEDTSRSSSNFKIKGEDEIKLEEHKRERGKREGYYHKERDYSGYEKVRHRRYNDTSEDFYSERRKRKK